MLCTVYRSERKFETYLYMGDETEWSDIPEELQRLFTPQVKVMTLKLTDDRKLARLSGEELRNHLSEQGYYLQVPPPPESLLIKPEK